MNRFRSVRCEAGMTLVEVLVTITILGVAIVGIVSGLGSTSRSSYVHRKQVTADTVVRSYGEAIKEKARLGGYVDCAGPGAYNNGTIYTPPAGFVVSQDTPLYQDSSALNVVLVLDVSSSINQAGAESQVENAAKGFLRALADTGSRVAIVTFGTRGTVVAPPTADTTAENRPDSYRSNLRYLESLIDGPALDIPPQGSPNQQWTNWDEGLMKARSLLGSFPTGKKTRIFVVTDGDPNAWIDDRGALQIDSSEAGTRRAVTEAKAQVGPMESTPPDTKIFAVGVTSNPKVPNLKELTGAPAIQYVPGSNSFESSDWMKVSDFNALQSALTDIASQVSAETFTERCPTPDQGAQLLTLRATTTDGAYSERLQMVVRRP